MVAILVLSCGLVLSQNAPRIIPNKPQNILMVNPLAILKPVTKFIGAFIASGFGGNMNTPYHDGYSNVR
jgi:hypothetical protein